TREQTPPARSQLEEEGTFVLGVRNTLRVPASLQAAAPEEDRRERHPELPRELGRGQGPLDADVDVKRIVLRGQLCALERRRDQALPFLVRCEDVEKNRALRQCTTTLW